MCYLEYERACWIHVFSEISQGMKTELFYSAHREHDIVCLQETHVKDEFLQAFQILTPQFRLYGTFIPNNLHAVGIGYMHP